MIFLTVVLLFTICLSPDTFWCDPRTLTRADGLACSRASPSVSRVWKSRPACTSQGIERTKLVSALRYFMVITDGIAKGEVGRSTLQDLRRVHSPSQLQFNRAISSNRIRVAVGRIRYAHSSPMRLRHLAGYLSLGLHSYRLAANWSINLYLPGCSAS
jgi:hypothetical protein